MDPFKRIINQNNEEVPLPNNKRPIIWFSMIMLGLAQFLVRFFRSSTGTLKSSLATSLSIPTSSLGVLSSCYFYPYMLMQLPAGYLADTLGTRLTVSIGMMVTAIGSTIFALAQNLTMLMIGRILIGFGVSVPVVTVQRFITTWFVGERQGTMTGIVSFIGNLGNVVAQVPLALLIEKISWRGSVGVMSGIALVASVSCFLIIKDNPEQLYAKRSLLSLGGNVEKAKAKHSGFFKSVWSCWSNKYIWPLMVILFVHMAINSVFLNTYAVPYLEDVFGYSTVEASGFATMMSIGTMFGNLIILHLSDRLRKRKGVLFGVVAASLCTWIMFVFGVELLRIKIILIIVLFINGCCHSTTALVFCCSKELNNPRSIGVAVSSVNTIGMIGSSVSPSICGRIMAKYISQGLSGKELYTKTFLIFMIIASLMLVAVIFLKETGCKNRYYELHPDKKLEQ